MRHFWNVCLCSLLYDLSMMQKIILLSVNLLPILNLYEFSQVVEAKSKAEEAKGKAQAALDKATATKKNIERSNNDLRDLIKQIRDFLTRES